MIAKILLTGSFTWLLAGLVAAVSLAQTETAFGQSENGAGNSAPVCMVRTTMSGTELGILTVATYQRGLLGKGFAPKPCNELFADLAAREAFRDEICLTASRRDETLQDTYEAHLGERPAVLCAMAEVAMGRWNRRDRR